MRKFGRLRLHLQHLGPHPVDAQPRVLSGLQGARRDRRSVPKIVVGSWSGRELYINVTQTYGCDWFDMRGVCHRHECCTLSRSCRRARPLGLIVAWLQRGLQASCLTKAQHRAYSPSHDERVAARAWFKTLPGADPWLTAEYPQGSGPEEPLLVAE